MVAGIAGAGAASPAEERHGVVRNLLVEYAREARRRLGVEDVRAVHTAGGLTAGGRDAGVEVLVTETPDVSGRVVRVDALAAPVVTVGQPDEEAVADVLPAHVDEGVHVGVRVYAFHVAVEVGVGGGVDKRVAHLGAVEPVAGGLGAADVRLADQHDRLCLQRGQVEGPDVRRAGRAGRVALLRGRGGDHCREDGGGPHRSSKLTGCEVPRY